MDTVRRWCPYTQNIPFGCAIDMYERRTKCRTEPMAMHVTSLGCIVLEFFNSKGSTNIRETTMQKIDKKTK